MLNQQRIRALWHSATLMSWLNIAARLLSPIAVLPMVLNRFSPPDIALYYLFVSVISLQVMFGSGFAPTIARFVSFVLAGAKADDLLALRLGGKASLKGNGAVDRATLASLIATAHRVFVLLSVFSIPAAAIFGTWALWAPVEATSDPAQSWIAWLVVLAATPFVMLGTRYSAFLQGANQIALDQRWGALFGIFSALSGLAAMGMGGGLLALVCVNQAWQIVAYFRLRHLSARVLSALVPALPAVGPSRDLFRAIWPASWRSLLGVASSNGLTALMGLIFAQFLVSEELARLLFGIRIMVLVAEVSRAPFYSRLPVLNGFRATGETHQLRAESRRGMQRAYVVFVGLVLAAPVAAQYLLPLIGSQISFPESSFWLLLGFATLVERMGAMHIQVYSTTNHIVWHRLNGGTGVLWVLLLLTTFPFLGLLAYPLSMLLAYTAYYSSRAAVLSIRSMGSGYWGFERGVFWPAAAALAVGGAGVLYITKA